MFKTIYKYIRNKYYLIRHRKKHVRFLKRTNIDAKCFFEGYNSIGEMNVLNNCYLGAGSYTGYNVRLNNVKIGRFCSIGSNIHNISGTHPTSQFVSTHPSFFSLSKVAGFTFTDKQLFTELNYEDGKYIVEVGNDVWIGDNVVILHNLKIGDGAIIGTNSLVTKDIEPYSINVGSPTRIIRYRFDVETISFLQNFKWWNKDFNWLKENYSHFKDIKIFRNRNK